MDIYRITSARPTDSGRWLGFAGTQDKARAMSKAIPQSRWNILKLDTRKEPLLETLNEALAQGASVGAAALQDAPPMEAPSLLPATQEAPVTQVARTIQKGEDERAARRAAAQARSGDIDLVTEAIHRADDYVFANILEAALTRLAELGDEGLRALEDRPQTVGVVRGLLRLGHVA